MLWPLSLLLFVGSVLMIAIGSLAIKAANTPSFARPRIIGNLNKTWGIVILVIGILLLIGGIFPLWY